MEKGIVMGLHFPSICMRAAGRLVYRFSTSDIRRKHGKARCFGSKPKGERELRYPHPIGVIGMVCLFVKWTLFTLQSILHHIRPCSRTSRVYHV